MRKKKTKNANKKTKNANKKNQKCEKKTTKNAKLWGSGCDPIEKPSYPNPKTSVIQ